MEKEFVPYVLSKQIKQLGFNEECFGYYDNWLNYGKEKTTFRLGLCKGDVKVIPAPLWSQAFDWFRQEKGYDNWIVPLHIFNRKLNYKKWCYLIEKSEYDEYFSIEDESERTTYEEAKLACLEKLIEIVENENKQKDL